MNSEIFAAAMFSRTVPPPHRRPDGKHKGGQPEWEIDLTIALAQYHTAQATLVVSAKPECPKRIDGKCRISQRHVIEVPTSMPHIRPGDLTVEVWLTARLHKSGHIAHPEHAVRDGYLGVV
ncbi:MAG TPA: hypothetical protein VN541_07530 [Tepidisphaeraceae bacterium]|nr:hypothetical protein [Tepidisphaeraceae bacterium]